MKQLKINVLQAAMQRFDTLFQEFDNIYVSFSGGKDSGLLLNLLIHYMRERGIHHAHRLLSSARG